MTDTIVQFRYSDDVFMTAIYIKSDSHQENFIPLLIGIVSDCEKIHQKRGWAYVVAEIVSKIVSDFNGLVKFILESQIEPTNCIYKYSITISEDLYCKQDNKLFDYLRIKYLDEEYKLKELIKKI